MLGILGLTEMEGTQYSKSRVKITELISRLRRANTSLLPTESELMQLVGAGRNTIRTVIGDLETAGELQRIQGKGTFLVEKSVRLTVSNWVSSEMRDERFFDMWFDQYMNSHPGVQVRNSRVPYHQYPSELLNRLVHVDAPDVVQITPFWLQSFQRLNVFAPIGRFMSEKFVKGQYEAANELVRCGDDVCGVNWTLCPLVLYTNRVVLEKAGIDPDTVPQTLEELAALSMRINERGKSSFFGFSLPLDLYAYSFLQMYPLLLAFGGGFSDAVGNLTIDSEANIRALRWIRSFYPAGGAQNVRNLDGGRILFASDRVAFLIDGPYGRGHYRHFSGLDSEFDSHYGVSLIPVGPSGRSESVLLSHATRRTPNSRSISSSISPLMSVTHSATSQSSA